MKNEIQTHKIYKKLCCFSGTWVNEVRLQPGVKWELSDGDTLIFGGQSAPGSPEFYFLFQKVKVRPLDFDAITIPKVIREVYGVDPSDLLRQMEKCNSGQFHIKMVPLQPTRWCCGEGNKPTANEFL